LAPSEYRTELEEVIKDETSGDFTTALLAMLKANKDESKEVDSHRARQDAEVRSAFKEGGWGHSACHKNALF